MLVAVRKQVLENSQLICRKVFSIFFCIGNYVERCVGLTDITQLFNPTLSDRGWVSVLTCEFQLNLIPFLYLIFILKREVVKNKTENQDERGKAFEKTLLLMPVLSQFALQTGTSARGFQWHLHRDGLPVCSYEKQVTELFNASAIFSKLLKICIQARHTIFDGLAKGFVSFDRNFTLY